MLNAPASASARARARARARRAKDASQDASERRANTQVRVRARTEAAAKAAAAAAAAPAPKENNGLKLLSKYQDKSLIADIAFFIMALGCLFFNPVSLLCQVTTLFMWVNLFHSYTVRPTDDRNEMLGLGLIVLVLPLFWMFSWESLFITGTFKFIERLSSHYNLLPESFFNSTSKNSSIHKAWFFWTLSFSGLLIAAHLLGVGGISFLTIVATMSAKQVLDWWLFAADSVEKACHNEHLQKVVYSVAKARFNCGLPKVAYTGDQGRLGVALRKKVLWSVLGFGLLFGGTWLTMGLAMMLPSSAALATAHPILFAICNIAAFLCGGLLYAALYLGTALEVFAKLQSQVFGDYKPLFYNHCGKILGVGLCLTIATTQGFLWGTAYGILGSELLLVLGCYSSLQSYLFTGNLEKGKELQYVNEVRRQRKKQKVERKTRPVNKQPIVPTRYCNLKAKFSAMVQLGMLTEAMNLIREERESQDFGQFSTGMGATFNDFDNTIDDEMRGEIIGVIDAQGFWKAKNYLGAAVYSLTGWAHPLGVSIKTLPDLAEAESGNDDKEQMKLQAVNNALKGWRPWSATTLKELYIDAYKTLYQGDVLEKYDTDTKEYRAVYLAQMQAKLVKRIAARDSDIFMRGWTSMKEGVGLVNAIVINSGQTLAGAGAAFVLIGNPLFQLGLTPGLSCQIVVLLSASIGILGSLLLTHYSSWVKRIREVTSDSIKPGLIEEDRKPLEHIIALVTAIYFSIGFSVSMAQKSIAVLGSLPNIMTSKTIVAATSALDTAVKVSMWHPYAIVTGLFTFAVLYMLSLTLLKTLTDRIYDACANSERRKPMLAKMAISLGIFCYFVVANPQLLKGFAISTVGQALPLILPIWVVLLTVTNAFTKVETAPDRDWHSWVKSLNILKNLVMLGGMVAFTGMCFTPEVLAMFQQSFLGSFGGTLVASIFYSFTALFQLGCFDQAYDSLASTLSVLAGGGNSSGGDSDLSSAGQEEVASPASSKSMKSKGINVAPSPDEAINTMSELEVGVFASLSAG
jgi:hypothetical protein